MEFEKAIAAAGDLASLLRDEIARAEAERRQVRELDSDGLFAWSRAREAFHANALSVQNELAAALAGLQRQFDLPEMRLDLLEGIDPELAGTLRTRLDDISDAAAALAEADRLNRLLVERALDCVRGYVGAMSRPTTTYDRMGKVSPAGPTGSRRGSL